MAKREVWSPVSAALDAKTLIDALPMAALVYDLDLVLLAQNRAHEIMTGTRRSEVIGRYMFEAFPTEPGAPSAEEGVRASIDRIRKTGQPDRLPIQEHALKTANGKWQTHFWQVTQSPLMKGGEMIAILQTSEDVTQPTLERLLGETQRLAAQEAAAISYFTFDFNDGHFIRAPSVDELFGFKPNEVGPSFNPFVDRIAKDDIDAVRAELARIRQAPIGTLAKFDHGIVIPGESERRYVRARGAIVIDPSDKTQKLVGVFIDMTDTQRTKERLERAMEDKENLLVEVNHRVTNSLQLVISVLRMEARRAKDPAVERILQVANSRVEAIAEVHSGLYVSGDVTRVATKPLLETLVASIGRWVGVSDDAARIECDADDFLLPTDLGVAFGLLVNELLTNAVKYGGESGSAQILARSHLDGRRVELTVSNEYRPQVTHSPENGTGIGTRLIEGFVRQLKAEQTIDIVDGRYVVEIHFELPEMT